MKDNQSINNTNNYIETLLIKYLFDKKAINKATFDKVREKIKCGGKEAA